MYRLYGMSSPNVLKVVIALEELGQPYDFRRVGVVAGEQHEGWFRALNPNGKVPVLVEPRADGDFALFESGAILLWLAERHGAFGGSDADARVRVQQWLMFQMAGVGPNFGQAIHFSFATRDAPYAQARFTIEMRRLLDVVERRLGEAPFLAGDYSVADMALWPWIRTIRRFFPGDSAGEALNRWFDSIEGRPAVNTALERMTSLEAEDRAAMKSASAEQLDRYFGRRESPN